MSRAKRSGEIPLENLQLAADLIQGFQQVSADKSHLKQRKCERKSYIQKFPIGFGSDLKSCGHQLKIKGEELRICTYPGVFAKIVTNLVMNSIQHGYQPEERGYLDFDISSRDDRLIISYADDGCGIPEEYRDKIFEPFFTTARLSGWSGLGLHIIYNLVIQKLLGQIYGDRQVSKDAKFILNLPIELQE